MSAPASKHFAVDILSRFAQAEEVEIDAPPSAATGMIRPRTIWVVVVDGAVYVRSWKGPAGHWYQAVSAHTQAVVYLDGHPIPVRVVPVSDEETRAQVSEAYRRKYLEDPFLRSMLRADVVPTTLRLEPQEQPRT